MVDAPLTFVDTNVLAHAHDRSEPVRRLVVLYASWPVVQVDCP